MPNPLGEGDKVSPDRREDTMRVPLSVEVSLERVRVDAHGKPGKGHVTVNGGVLCENHPRSEFRKYPLEYITVAEFMKNPCGSCLKRLNHRAEKG
jgi:hypothetical protein